MRLAWYAGASTALAVSVVISAFHQRANFYSAMVYLAQSNFCLLALINFIYIVYGAFMFGLQRLCFGRLRAVEVDQLSDRAWVAITETCLAMTIFREEIGAWFLVMFTALVTGKVWGWIGDGRLEILEQQPPANPRLFHTRLTVSLLMSTFYDMWLLRYCVNTVIQQARPNMMVMFLFEFAVLTASSLRTNSRYALALVDARIVAHQTQKRLVERRKEVQEQRDQMLREREAAEAEGREHTISEADIPNPDDIDEMDIEVPGWEAKGQWILTLELFTDFIKLSIYIAFFTVLLMFYGLPVHIMREVYITASAFFKRLSALLKYRRAIQSMSKYPDATAEDLGREDTCIICREEMKPWDPETNPGAVERTRPKKLPCGHILHFGCLRSWLERQQVCPTCRSPVVLDGQSTNRDQNRRPRVVPGVQPQQQQAQGQPDEQQRQLPGPFQRPGQGDQGTGQNNDAGAHDNEPQPAPPRHRMFNFGPFRLEFIRQELRNPQQLDAFLGGELGGAAENAAPPPPTNVQASSPTSILSSGFDNIVNRELTSLQNLQHMQHELQTASLLLAELVRLRQLRATTENAPHNPTASSTPHHTQPNTPSSQVPPQIQHSRTPPPPGALPHHPSTFSHLAPPYPYRPSSSVLSRYAAPPNTTAIPAGSSELPEGVVLPPGWSLLPLQRMDNSSGVPLTATPPPQPTEVTAGPSTQPTTSSAAAPAHSGINGSTVHTRHTEAPRPGMAFPRPQPPEAAAAAALAASAAAAASAASVPPRPSQDDDDRPTPVLAPNPVMPNWGGSSQLFSNQARLSSNSTPDIPEAEEESDESEEESDQEASNQRHPPPVPNRDDAGESSNGPLNGKGKAVTMEDASSSEEEEDEDSDEE
ncbi:hypothetical protein jhhlp_001828 [Lomentospora prolificans]|uniref:RING-type E3 ubiquitin transferase n=1 Tax=Lomentospora prolificans TaxID=41688 RepID=A0A2N3NGY8_9PEZI|nr:hypothetical protein jhhlp_001828 [Lomentospora prolificans]